MFLAFVLLLVTFGLGQWALAVHRAEPRDEKRLRLVGAGAVAALLAALAAYLTRPGLDEIDRRVAAAMTPETPGEDGEGLQAGDLKLTCKLVPERSRVTGSDTEDIDLDWTPDGCVNTRTQYGFASGSWSRVFVPDEEDAVSVSSFDPDRRMYRVERYLLSRSAMEEARTARAKYDAPMCGTEGAAAKLGDLQGEMLGQLPQQPNERLVYECSTRPSAPGG